MVPEIFKKKKSLNKIFCFGSKCRFNYPFPSLPFSEKFRLLIHPVSFFLNFNVFFFFFFFLMPQEDRTVESKSVRSKILTWSVVRDRQFFRTEYTRDKKSVRAKNHERISGSKINLKKKKKSPLLSLFFFPTTI